MSANPERTSADLPLRGLNFLFACADHSWMFTVYAIEAPNRRQRRLGTPAGHEHGEVEFPTLANAMQWLEQMLMEESTCCSDPDDPQEQQFVRYGITFEPGDVFNAMKPCAAPILHSDPARPKPPLPDGVRLVSK